MAADKKPMIVIKRIEEGGHGHHGGAWKVAFADFMTAMMAFFLVMWLLATANPQTKQNVADYMSTPSVIEYNFQNYGAIATLEKLFLDLVNEPLKVMDKWLRPIGKDIDVLDMKNEKAALNYLTDELGDFAKTFTVESDFAEFELADTVFFKRGKDELAQEYYSAMQVIRQIVGGLKKADILLTVVVYQDGMIDKNLDNAKNMAQRRAQILQTELQKSAQSEKVQISVQALATVRTQTTAKDSGFVKLTLRKTGSDRTEIEAPVAPGAGLRARDPQSTGAEANGTQKVDANLQNSTDISVPSSYDEFVEGLTKGPPNESGTSESSNSGE